MFLDGLKRAALVCVIVGMLRLLAYLIFNGIMSVYWVTRVEVFKAVANVFDLEIFRFSVTMLLFWFAVAICYAAVIFIVKQMEYSTDKAY